jgi:hypothetical protein
MLRRFASRLMAIFAPVILAGGVGAPAAAGPPYLSDDPEPTDPGHWEIYNYVIGINGTGGIGAVGTGGLSGEGGFDINYGAAKDLQLTAVLPLAFANADGASFHGLTGGPGIIELAAKYKFLHQGQDSWLPDVSLFPRLFVPTTDQFSTGHLNLFLPVWAEKDFGPWSVFGGGGYQINPGPGQDSFWQGGIALSHALGKRASLGAEIYAQGRDSVAGGGYTAANFAATYRLTPHWSLLASAGPTWDEGGGHGQVFYFALKADY